MIVLRHAVILLSAIVFLPMQLAYGQTAKPVRILVLNPEAGFLGASKLTRLGDHLRSLADRYTTIQVAKPPRLSAEKLRQRAGCARASSDCLVKIGQVEKMDRVLRTAIQRLPGRYLVVMTLVDVKQGSEIAQARKRSPKQLEAIQNVMLQCWVELMGPLYRSRLTIRSNVVGAKVFVDGSRVGTTPLVLIKELSRGMHVVELSHEGYQPTRREIRIETGKEHMIDEPMQATASRLAKAPKGGFKLPGTKASSAPLVEEPPAVATPEPNRKALATRPPLGSRPRPFLPEADKNALGKEATGEAAPQATSSQPFYKRWWFWTAVGAVVVAGGVSGVVLGLSSEGGIPSGKGRVIVEF